MYARQQISKLLLSSNLATEAPRNNKAATNSIVRSVASLALNQVSPWFKYNLHERTHRLSQESNQEKSRFKTRSSKTIITIHEKYKITKTLPILSDHTVCYVIKRLDIHSVFLCDNYNCSSFVRKINYRKCIQQYARLPKVHEKQYPVLCLLL